MSLESVECDSFFISGEEAGIRLDKILANRFSQAGSRTYFQFLINEQKVLLNGAPVKKRILPKMGDEIEIEYLLTPELTLKPENLPLNIIFEDEAILVVNKMPGMVVHPAPGNWSGTFVNALLYHCREIEARHKENPATLRPGIVHRLDKETSGLLISAKTSQAQQRLIEMFANRRIYKEYLAICVGNPGSGTLDLPIGRHPSNRKLMAIQENGRQAITHFHSLGVNEKLSLVRVVIETGRTHQIRVHMKHRKTPVLGDSLYGSPSLNAKFNAKRQMLHSYRLKFEHPLTGNPLEFQAEIPQDMQGFIGFTGYRPAFRSDTSV
jgi:23S rRNA pseudouridine1911/1915/1917 synthase